MHRLTFDPGQCRVLLLVGNVFAYKLHQCPPANRQQRLLRHVNSSTLSTFWLGVSQALGDVILALLACPLSDVIFCTIGFFHE